MDIDFPEGKIHVEENVQKSFRLHVGGLGPTILPQDLEKRFSSFGTVVQVDGVGKLDANGFPLNYAFVDILSTDLQIKRCMNLLSGTTYKGNTLRIAPARPDYIVRAQREKANLPINTFMDPDEAALQEREAKEALKLERKLAKMWAREKGIEGYQSTNTELMTLQKFKSRQGTNGWKKDPETLLPIFPIITRPIRPLPSLDLANSEEIDPKQKSPSVRALTRARRTRIDPTTYRATIKNRKTHIIGPRAMSIEQFKLGFSNGAKNLKKSQATQPMWECHLDKDGYAVWTLRSGEDAQEERVRLSRYTLKELSDVGQRESDHPQLTQICNSPGRCSPQERSTSIGQQTNITSELLQETSGPTGNALSEDTLLHHPEACAGILTSPLRLRGGSSIKKNTHHNSISDVQLSNLTDMFKAKEEEKKGFCLNDALGGIELDENVLAVQDDSQMEITPSYPSLPREKLQDDKQAKSKAFIHPSRLKGASALASQVGSRIKSGERKGPFFFYPTNEDPDSQVIDSLLSPERREGAQQSWLSHNSSTTSHGWRTFLTTESMSHIKSEHNQKKSQLTEHMRRKHKDALKQERKWGSKQATKSSALKGLDAGSDTSI